MEKPPFKRSSHPSTSVSPTRGRQDMLRLSAGSGPAAILRDALSLKSGCVRINSLIHA